GPDGDPDRAQDQRSIVDEHLYVSDQAGPPGSDDLPHVDQVVPELLPVRNVSWREELRRSRQPRPHQLAALVARHVADVHVLLDPSDLDPLLLRLRARADEAHLPQEDVPELWELVHGRTPEHPAGSCDPRIAPSGLDLDVRGILEHGSKLQDTKEPALTPESWLAEEDRSAVLEPDRRGNEDPQRRCHHEPDPGQTHIERALEHRLAKRRRTILNLDPVMP